jgi:DNA-binding XRE family transcriptional regulator
LDKAEFAKIRHKLDKTQNELARLLCVSPKAIQSFEQGWRNIPANAERQLRFLLSSKRSVDETNRPCWEIRNCPVEWRDKCAAWEFRAGYYCWFINGTFCEGYAHKSWEDKITQCHHCQVYNSMFL